MSKFTDKLAKKVLEPYMEKILRCAYDLRCLSYAMPFDRWCVKFNEHLKEINESDGNEKC